MSIREQQLEQIESKIRRLHQSEKNAEKRWQQQLYKTERWFWMLIREFISDDVQVRAESLAYLTLFSLLPLTAGGFLIFNFLAQFGLVQETLGQVFQDVLLKIPAEHREIVTDYVMQFKADYLKSLNSKSGSIGIFALAILIWIGLKTFSNVDRTLNHIWSSDYERSFIQKLSNFILVTVAAPILTTAALTVPLILVRFDVPFAGRVIGNITPVIVLFGLFSFLYRFVPVAEIRWKAVFFGAGFTTLGLEASNILMQIYFKFGTQSAYGKLAILPLLAFWIYLSWVVIILGAQVGYLIQNGRDILDKREFEPTFRETEGVIRILETLKSAFHNGSGPVTFDQLRVDTGLPSNSLGRVLRYLVRKHWIMRSDDGYGLGKDLSTMKWPELLEDYIQHSVSLKAKPKDAVEEQFQQAVRRFLSF